MSFGIGPAGPCRCGEGGEELPAEGGSRHGRRRANRYFPSLADRLRSHAILAFGKDEVGGHVRRPINPDAQSRKRRWSICGNFGERKCIACAQRSPGYSFGRQWYELHGDRNVACDYRPP